MVRKGHENHVHSISCPQIRRKFHLEKHGSIVHTLRFSYSIHICGYFHYNARRIILHLHKALSMPKFSVRVDNFLMRFKSFITSRAKHISQGHIRIRCNSIINVKKILKKHHDRFFYRINFVSLFVIDDSIFL